MRSSSYRRGTSLVELLVVIVVFLIGILAVAQIFPGGFKILAGTRARSLATTVARAESERLKARPDLLPEAILPVRVEVGGAIVTQEQNPNEYAPALSGIDSAGNGIDVNGATLNVKWGRLSGANTTRRIVGETHRIGAPRFLSPRADAGPQYFGGLVALQFGPVDYDPAASASVSVYGRDLFRIPLTIPNGTPPLTATDVPREYEYILANANVGNQATNPSAFFLPAPLPPATGAFQYSLSLAVYLDQGGTLIRREVELPAPFAVTDADDPDNRGYAYLRVDAIPGVVPVGATLLGVERDSVRLARAFRLVPEGNAFTADPYEYRILNPFLGTLLFNPAGYNRFEQRPGEARRPFAARVNYNVYDWRLLREDFRIPRTRFDGLPTTAAMPASVRLAISPLRAQGDAGADGLTAQPMEAILNGPDPYIPAAGRDNRQDHFVLLDLETGGVYHEQTNGRLLIDVNKSTGRVKFSPLNAGDPELSGRLRLPDGRDVDVADIGNRAVRAFYVAKDEWAVQVLRAPARYSRFQATPGLRPVTGTYAFGADLGVEATRIYFPPADAGRKVSIGRISYLAAGNVRKLYEGGDFVLRYGGALGTLPFLDIRDVAGDAIGLDPNVESALANVRGASIVVRVFHNDSKITLGLTAGDNLLGNGPFDRYQRQWRVDTKETSIEGGEPLQ